MTGREQLLAASRGSELEVKPVLMGTFQPAAGAEGYVVELSQVEDCLDQAPESACLVRVTCPLGRTIESGEKLIGQLHENPSDGEARLSEIRDMVRTEIDEALGKGADGVFYVVDGASGEFSTPMEYGGHFLEVDREVLNEYSGARLNAVYVEGVEPYLEFVADLPAHLFGWDITRSERDLNFVRAIRDGAIFASTPEADIYYSADLTLNASVVGGRS